MHYIHKTKRRRKTRFLSKAGVIWLTVILLAGPVAGCVTLLILNS